MTEADISGPWRAHVARLARAADRADLVPLPHDPARVAAFHRQLAMDLALGYFMHFGATPLQPDFTPFLNSHFLLQPNPDDTYVFTPIRGDLSYRITGQRGTVKLLTFTTSQDKMGMAQTMGPAFDYIDADTLRIGADGRYDFILSPERPPGYTGDWRALNPKADNIVLRRRSYDWEGEVDATVSITCLENTGPKIPLAPDEIQSRIGRMMGEYPQNLSDIWLGYVQKTMARTDIVNKAHLTQFPSGLRDQTYWEAIFRITEGEAVIVETPLPAEVRYWNVQLNDPLFNAVEFVHGQGSLNGHQAHIDSDGMFRAVISLTDPQVPNWLDPAGHREGTMIGRWFGASDFPEPLLKRVPNADLRTHLPADTPRIDKAARAEALAARSRGAQIRRRW